MRFRIKHVDERRGMRQYFWKAAPRLGLRDARETDMASGIRDKVAILGMGCSKFGERWDAEPSDLMAEAFEECIADAGIERSQIDAAWLSTAFDSVNVGPSALPLATALRLAIHPRHARREHVRQRHGGLPRGMLRGGLGRRGLRARARRGRS